MANVDIILRMIDKTGEGKRGVIGSFTELKSAIDLAGQGLRLLGDIYDATAGDALKYAAQVRELSMISGTSAEETSRFIQVLDDYKVSSADALAATSALTKEGHTPSIETLAGLSDEYLSLNSAQERNEFVLKNLGRAGLQWVDVLNQGSAALLEQGQRVQESLILSEEQIKAAMLNELATDRLNDTMKGLTYTVGNETVPVWSTLQNHISAVLVAEQRLQTEGLRPGTKDWFDRRTELIQVVKDEQAAEDAIIASTEALEDNSFALLLDEEATKKLHEANSAMIGTILSVQAQVDSYADSSENLREKQSDLLNQIESLRSQGVAELDSSMIQLQQEYANTGVAIDELALKHEEAMKRIVFSLLMSKLEAEGLTSAEFHIALAAGEALGVVDASTAEIAVKFDALATKIAESGNSMMASGATGMFSTIMSGGNLTDFNVKPAGYVFDNIPDNGGWRAGGGPVSAGGSYIVGENGPELFVPGVDGGIVPNGAMGGSVNVSVHLNYSPALGFANAGDFERAMPTLGEAVRRELGDLGIHR